MASGELRWRSSAPRVRRAIRVIRLAHTQEGGWRLGGGASPRGGRWLARGAASRRANMAAFAHARSSPARPPHYKYSGQRWTLNHLRNSCTCSQPPMTSSPLGPRQQSTICKLKTILESVDYRAPLQRHLDGFIHNSFINSPAEIPPNSAETRTTVTWQWYIYETENNCVIQPQWASFIDHHRRTLINKWKQA